MQIELIEALSEEKSSPLINSIKIDPVFWIDSRLRIVESQNSEETTASIQTIENHLAFRITRNPRDLLAHTQRVYLWLAANNRARVCSSLLDLYIGLKDRGYSLRQHLLTHCESLLISEQREWFKANLNQPISNYVGLPETDQSLLHTGVEGELELVSKNDTPDASFETNPLTIAREYLENGQTSLSVEVLEKQNLSYPSDREIEEELLNIYEYGGFIKEYLIQSRNLLINGHSLTTEWQDRKQSIHSTYKKQ